MSSRSHLVQRRIASASKIILVEDKNSPSVAAGTTIIFRSDRTKHVVASESDYLSNLGLQSASQTVVLSRRTNNVLRFIDSHPRRERSRTNLLRRAHLIVGTMVDAAPELLRSIRNTPRNLGACSQPPELWQSRPRQCEYQLFA